MLDLLEPDDVVYGEDLEGKILPTRSIPAQTDAGKGAWEGKVTFQPCHHQYCHPIAFPYIHIMILHSVELLL